jgi:hypothetical protein
MGLQLNSKSRMGTMPEAAGCDGLAFPQYRQFVKLKKPR